MPRPPKMTQLRISSYFADSSIMHALYAVSLRRPAILPPAPFRPCLAATPLLLANDFELSFRAVLATDFHHQINAHAGQTKNNSGQSLELKLRERRGSNPSPY